MHKLFDQAVRGLLFMILNEESVCLTWDQIFKIVLKVKDLESSLCVRLIVFGLWTWGITRKNMQNVVFVVRYCIQD